MNNKWQIGQAIATIVIAVIAVCGFVLSLNSSREVSRRLSDVSEVLEGYAIPVIAFVSYNWTGTGKFSCENPPRGIVVRFANRSNLPVVHTEKIRFYTGEAELKAFGTVGSPGPTIMATGQSSVSSYQSPDLQKFLATRKSLFTPPFVRVEVERKMWTLGRKDRPYDYRARWLIGFDCRTPKARRAHTEYEELEPAEQ